MTMGPIELLLLGAVDTDFGDRLAAELDRLRASDVIRVIDALVLTMTPDGGVETLRLGNLSPQEAVELGGTIGALAGFRLDGPAGAREGAEVGATEAATEGMSVFTEDDAYELLAGVPDGSAVAMLLLEHHWASGLRDVLARSGASTIASRVLLAGDLAGEPSDSLDDAAQRRRAEFLVARG
jgi:uncharacterized membrane protein